jgi:hypothetical protein
MDAEEVRADHEVDRNERVARPEPADLPGEPSLERAQVRGQRGAPDQNPAPFPKEKRIEA